MPFHLFDYQRDVLTAFTQHQQVIILKARQLGMSELVCAYAVWRALKPRQDILLISQGEAEAAELITKCRTCYDHLPDWLAPPLAHPNRTSTLELANGSRILPKPATARAGRSYNAQLLIFDEWAHQQFQAEIFAAAAPAALSAGNQLIGISTANGVGNLFHQQWELAREGRGMHPIFLPWHVRPGRDAAWYEETTKTSLDWQRAQEHPDSAEDAFILSGRPRFDTRALAAIAAQCRDPSFTEAVGQDAEGRVAGFQHTWIAPLPRHRYVCGADTAEGLPHGDYCAAVILDWETGTEVAELHGHWPPEVFAHHLAALCTRYNAALCGVERNNHGHAVLLALARLEHYTRLYRHVEYDKRTQAGIDQPAGWSTTSKSKPIMIDALATAISEQRPFRNSRFIAEARTYTVLDNGDTAASPGAHDDRVIAYAIAEQLRRAPQRASAGATGGQRTPITVYQAPSR